MKIISAFLAILMALTIHASAKGSPGFTSSMRFTPRTTYSAPKAAPVSPKITTTSVYRPAPVVRQTVVVQPRYVVYNSGGIHPFFWYWMWTQAATSHYGQNGVQWETTEPSHIRPWVPWTVCGVVVVGIAWLLLI